MSKYILSPSKSEYLWIIICIAILGIGLYLFRTNIFTSEVLDSEQTNENSSHVRSQKDQNKVPHYVSSTLHYIKAFDKAPEKQVGGRKFQNREKKLPNLNNSGDSIHYREWDVHPYKKGKSRGPERLITGSDGSAYYTDDHYLSFVKIE
ncbi:MAG: ribonuclease [Saprospiraceae bacterium]|nr:ribonuclease [Saprospiraceae bacterium]